ncbi:MAG TPA: hypothetical protein VF222_03375 [Nitrososphaeraceae archaeon]
MLDEVDAEELPTQTTAISGVQGSSLSAMINNALWGNVNSNLPDSTASEYVMEQFITINPDGYNDNIIFEEPKKKVELLNSNVPFILPVPFP